MEQSRDFTGAGDRPAKDLFTGKEADLELGLGLSLGGGAAAKGCAQYGRRILTAKDFPNGFSSGRAGAGTKRDRPDDNGASPAAASQVVGWPPVRAFRMNTISGQAKSSNVEEDKKTAGKEPIEKSKKKVNHGSAEKNEVKETRRNVGFLKVNMDGLPIGRKVDLSAHSAYESLANTLGDMFFKPSLTTRGIKELSIQPSKLLDGSSEFVLTYEDKDGDWMLVGDVPWRMFINTAKRLRIMRTSEANGLGPKSQDRDDKQKGKPI